tara:strand:- start:3935 stop:4252 length:318 start_codon:yes stop_codon:yes gene_type:complete
MANEENIKKHQFKKGQSGNPLGRPVGSKNRNSVASKWLNTTEETKNPITGLIEVLSQEDIMTLAILKKGRQGDVRAYDSLLDSCYGKAVQTNDVNVNRDGPLFME